MPKQYKKAIILVNSHCLQVWIGQGCLIFEVFSLEYGGPFNCPAVQYMTGGIIGGATIIVVIVIACYRGRHRIRDFVYVIIPSLYPDMPQVIIISGYGTIYPPLWQKVPVPPSVTLWWYLFLRHNLIFFRKLITSQ